MFAEQSRPQGELPSVTLPSSRYPAFSARVPWLGADLQTLRNALRGPALALGCIAITCVVTVVAVTTVVVTTYAVTAYVAGSAVHTTIGVAGRYTRVTTAEKKK